MAALANINHLFQLPRITLWRQSTGLCSRYSPSQKMHQAIYIAKQEESPMLWLVYAKKKKKKKDCRAVPSSSIVLVVMILSGLPPLLHLQPWHTQQSVAPTIVHSYLKHSYSTQPWQAKWGSEYHAVKSVISSFYHTVSFLEHDPAKPHEQV